MTGTPGRSKLVPLGFALMIVGIAFPRALGTLTAGMEPGLGQTVVSILSLVLAGGFLVGMVLAGVGLVRNRRALKG